MVRIVALAAIVSACGSDDPSGQAGDGGAGASSSTGGASTAAGGGGNAPSTGGAPSSTGGNAGASTGGGTNASGGTGPALDGAPAEGCATPDECPMATGLSHACKQRFALGLNYAWHNFAGDFGGISPWNQRSVSQDPDPIDAELAAMRAGGASVIRWWVFPDFRGDGVTFDGSGDPSGLSSVALADVGKALELAAANDVHLVLTIFSFDNFRPDHDESGILVRGMAPMASDPARRSRLIENVVRPLARAAAESAYADHLLGWDVINEPEWAVAPTGSAPGGQDFTPNGELTAVSLAAMKDFIVETVAVLEEETPDALTSVGWAAAKWAWAFEDIAVDFDQPHIYAWVDQYWPYTLSPAELGYGTRPLVMGEFALAQMPFSENGNDATLTQILESWWDDGYGGAWAWQFIEAGQSLPIIQSFRTDKGCPAGF